MMDEIDREGGGYATAPVRRGEADGARRDAEARHACRGEAQRRYAHAAPGGAGRQVCATRRRRDRIVGVAARVEDGRR